MSTPSSSLNRIPCKICGAEILLATAERNEGLCGRCAKGARPCIYCGQHVYETLRGGVYAHVGCWIRNRELQESLGWKTIKDIDWATIRHVLRTALRRLCECVAKERRNTEPITLVLCVHVEDFTELMVYEIKGGGTPVRLSELDPKWESDFSPFASSFSIMCETLDEQAAFDAAENVTGSLVAILSDECTVLQQENFCFSKTIPVSWSIKSD